MILWFTSGPLVRPEPTMTRKYSMHSRDGRSPKRPPMLPGLCIRCGKVPPTSKKGRGNCKPCQDIIRSEANALANASDRAYKETLRAWKNGTLDWNAPLPNIGMRDWPDDFLEELLEHKCSQSDNRAWGLGRDWL